MLKYACGNPDEELQLGEHDCQPVYDHLGVRGNGEKCFCQGDYCFQPEDDEKYLKQFRERKGPVYVGK